jgi:ferredoxin-NADP reductase
MKFLQTNSRSSLKLSIINIVEEAPEVKTFTLQPLNGSPLSYEAGQFITLSFPMPGGEERRSYSFSSSPVLHEAAAITLKRIPNGIFSRWLIDKAVVGDELTATSIAGMFTLPPLQAGTRCIVLFAAGIGITPLYSMLKTALFGHAALRVILVYSNKSVQDTVFYNELRKLEVHFEGRLTIEWLFSDHKNLMRARIGRPFLASFIKELKNNYPLSDCLFYICGPTDYRWVIALLLEENGIPNIQIRKEVFVNERLPVPQTPPDTREHLVSIHLENKTFNLTVQYPDTILSAARKAGIPIPYSCQAGRCSSCVAQCTTGKVWLSYNEVLTDTDLQKGLVLTCVGYPVDGDVTLAF